MREALLAIAQDPRFKDRGEQILNETLPGQMDLLKKSANEAGEVIGGVAVPALKALIGEARQLAEFARDHPGLTKAATYSVAAGGLALGGAGALNMVQGGLGVVGRVLPDKITDSKIGDMIFGGGSQQRAATTQLTAAEMQLEAARMKLSGGLPIPGAPGVATDIAADAALDVAAGGAAAKAGLGSRLGNALNGAKGLLGKNIATLPGNMIPELEAALAAAVPGSREAATAAAKLSAARNLGLGTSALEGSFLAARGLTVGGAALGAAGGVLGGISSYQDMQALGKDTATSLATGAFVGVGEAATAMFVPGGAIAVAFAEGFRFLINERMNKPYEEAPENNPNIDFAPPGSVDSSMSDGGGAFY